MILNLERMTLGVDFQKGEISSLIICGRERLSAPSPLFKLRLRGCDGNALVIDSRDAHVCEEKEDGAVYTDFSAAEISVRVYLSNEDGEAAWRITITPQDSRYFAEWVDFPTISLSKLEANSVCKNGGKVLFPYNEGVLISDIERRENMWMKHTDAEGSKR